nr:energy transducer TonB [uncultured Allomuricauda sp.]
MNLNREQLSFLITFFSMALVVLLLYNIHLGGMEEEEYVIELSLADEDIEELLKEEEKRLEEMANNDPIKSHMALNETAKPTIGNPEPLKTLEELMEERELTSDASEYSAADGAYADYLKKLAEKRQEKKQQLSEREEQKESFTNALKDKRTSISYSLVDRNAYSLPPPIYTCIEGGKVVINIKVDNNGYVTEADFNAQSSGTSNGCLVDNAIKYASKARFSPDKKNSQIGTITYLFQSK